MSNKQSNKVNKPTHTIDDKIALLEKSVALVFNHNKVAIIAKHVIDSLEFKHDIGIIADLCNINDSTIVSKMITTLKTELQIEWNTENQNTFYNILVQIFKQNQNNINIIMMNNISNSQNNTDDIKVLDEDKKKGILIVGGSYNPCHTEHVEMLYEIKRHLEENENFIIIAAYLVVTTDGYVIGKLQDAAMTFEHRHKICELTASKYSWCHPSHIPIVSAKQYARMITMKKSFNKYFGSNKLINESEINMLVTINCCGADKVSASWIKSYNMYGSTSLTACIARKGYNEDIKEAYDNAKAKGECNGFVYLNVECKPISSTLIRKHLFQLRDKMCNKIKDGGGWKMKKRVNNKYKQQFRNNVKDMLHPDVIEYLIDHIHDLWIVPKGKVMGGGKPCNVVTNSARKKKKKSDVNKKKKWWSFK